VGSHDGRRATATQLRRGEAATWSARTAEAPRLRLRIWKRAPEKPGSSLVGFANFTLTIGAAWLEIDDLPVLRTQGRAWAAWPAKPTVTREGTVARIPGTSKIRYVSILRWADRETSQRFSQAVVELVRQRDPGAFDDGGEP
jgi:hypothetical protein